MAMAQPIKAEPEVADHTPGSVLYNLQALRAVAASLVVFYHVQNSAARIAHRPYHSDFGAFGVDIFFVISGFIMFHTTAGFRRTGPEFVMDRLIRVVPLYWIATLALYALYLAGFKPNGIHLATPLDVVTSALFIPRMLPNGTSPLLLGLGWTLIYEFVFYLLFAATFFMRSHARSLAALSVCFVLLACLPAAVPHLPFTAVYFTNTIMFEFVFGAGLALLFPRIPVERNTLLALCGLALIALGFIAVVDVPVHHLDKTLTLDSRALRAGIPAATIVAGALVLERTGFRWRSPPIMLLGAASYALYLFHPFILQPAMKVFAKIVHGEGWWIVIAANLFAFAGSAAVAIAVHFFLERPVTKVLRRPSSRRDTAKRVAAEAR